MRRSLVLLVAAAFLAGCPQGSPVSPTAKPIKRPGKTVEPSLAPTGTTQPVQAVEPHRAVSASAAELIGKVKLIGTVKLISDKGLGIISNNTGSLVSNNGGGLVSNNGSNYAVLQSGGREESLLADATIEILDGQGRMLVGADDKPITATTDAKGQYVLNASVPKENLVLRVRLFQGGQLFAVLPKAMTDGEGTAAIDTASSLAASYVLERYVKKRADVFAKLPGNEAEALNKELQTARRQLADKVPSYLPQDLVATTEELRGKVTSLDTTLKRIEAILLAGQTNLGNGLQADQVALGLPYAAVGDPAGGFYLVEWVGGRIRKVDAAGTITTLAGVGGKNAPPESKLWGPLGDIVRKSDGTLVVAAAATGQIWSVTPDGKAVKLAGTTKSEVGSVDVPAATAPINHPRCLALAPDGTLYLGEYPTEGGDQLKSGRLLKITPDGTLKEVALPSALSGRKLFFTGLACGADGTLYAAESAATDVYKLPPGGEWQAISANAGDGTKRLAVAADGTLHLADFTRNRVYKLDTGGAWTAVAGNGEAGPSGDGPATTLKLYEPAGMWCAPDGSMLIADSGNGLIRRLGKDGQLKTVAGTVSATVQGNATQLAVNSPSGVAVDPQGRLVVTETAGSTIKRLENRVLTIIAGGGKGSSGDGGPAKQAQFDFPSGLAYAGDVLYVADSANGRVRKIDAAGTITTVAGNGGAERAVVAGGPHPALSIGIGRPSLLAIDKNGLPYWSDFVNCLVMRLTPDGKVEVVAGGAPASVTDPVKSGDEGDGGPANKSLLNRPVGLAFDKAGNLYVADTANMRIRKIAPDGTISAFAGLPLMQSLGQLSAGKPPAAGAKASETALAAPAGLVFDDAGNLYVSTLGTRNITFFGMGDDEGTIPTDLLPQVPAGIYKITPDGGISVIAGPGGKVLSDPDAEDALQVPSGLAFDREGRLVIVDTGANQIRLLPKESL